MQEVKLTPWLPDDGAGTADWIETTFSELGSGKPAGSFLAVIVRPPARFFEGLTEA